jgi:hypothetical protein
MSCGFCANLFIGQQQENNMRSDKIEVYIHLIWTT